MCSWDILGVNETFHCLLKYFFWPGLKTLVAKFCRECKVCQKAEKPNQKVLPATLCPIPVIGEPFWRVIVDCVGPLPRAKSGHQYVISIMCATKRFPEAVPLCSLKTQVVVKELVKFFTAFGLPQVVQSDQGTNFTSKMFAQVLCELGIKHQTSSAHHPESEGCLQRFHQTLKSMIWLIVCKRGKIGSKDNPFLHLPPVIPCRNH